MTFLSKRKHKQLMPPEEDAIIYNKQQTAPFTVARILPTARFGHYCKQVHQPQWFGFCKQKPNHCKQKPVQAK